MEKFEEVQDKILDALEVEGITVADAVAILEITKHTLINAIETGMPAGETLQ